MENNFIVLKYNVKQYPFQDMLCKQVFKIPRLEQLHLVWKKQNKREELNYKDNLALRKLMQRLPDESLFYKIYHKWVANILAPHYANKISYSAHPKMRVHLAGTGTVSDFHRDVDVTKRHDQINCYLPFTDVFESSTLWYQKDYKSNDYKPMNLKYGEALLWDGGWLKHGTYKNTTNNTRVSCDFRFHAKILDRVKSPWKDVLSGRKSSISSSV